MTADKKLKYTRIHATHAHVPMLCFPSIIVCNQITFPLNDETQFFDGFCLFFYFNFTQYSTNFWCAFQQFRYVSLFYLQIIKITSTTKWHKCLKSYLLSIFSFLHDTNLMWRLMNEIRQNCSREKFSLNNINDIKCSRIVEFDKSRETFHSLIVDVNLHVSENVTQSVLALSQEFEQQTHLKKIVHKLLLETL